MMSVSTSARPATRAVKVNSDQRKEQNRIASRNYRAKRKQKLALLEHILSDPAPSVSLSVAGTSQPSIEEEQTVPQVPVHQLSLWPKELSNEMAAATAVSAAADPMPAVSAASYPDPAIPSWMMPLSVPQLSFPADCAPPPKPAALPTATACLDLPVVGGGDGFMPDLFLCPDLPVQTISSASSPDPADIGHPPIRRNKASIDSLLRGVRALQPSQKRRLLQALLEEEQEDRSEDHDSADSANINANANTNGTLALDRRARSFSPLSTLTLHLRRTAFRAAVFHNCLAFGLPDPAHMFGDETNPVTGVCEADELQSPFAIDPATAGAAVARGPAHVAACVAAARRRLLQRQARLGRTTPRDLLPIDAQILVAHHPYLDVIPFRGFRARALALLAEMEGQPAAALSTVTGVFGGLSLSESSTTPATSTSTSSLAPLAALFDEYELCYDMDFADGLVCWGSANGSTTGGLSAQARRAGRPGGMQACVPWDMRGWEPQVWFLKKYWYLVGGWDDEMWRNCRWWHSMRGEHLDYSVFAEPGY